MHRPPTTHTPPGAPADGAALVCCDAAQLGRSLSTWRALRRLKQAHVGELLGVSQTTVSRWEGGTRAPTPAEQAAIRALMQAKLDSAADFELARLVTQSPRAVHLICDLTHKLLALSARREAEARIGRAAMLGTSLFRFASDELQAAEATLPGLGWFEPAPPAVEGVTGSNQSTDWRIYRSRYRWVRFQLSDGTFARLVETLDPEGHAAREAHRPIVAKLDKARRPRARRSRGAAGASFARPAPEGRPRVDAAFEGPGAGLRAAALPGPAASPTVGGRYGGAP